MPKPDDYSNTIIYKITCRDPEIKDVYVGHTVDFIQRKHTHKQSCNNEKNDCKLYNTIRAKGGWNNWKMEIVNFFDCVDHYEARQKEQEYFVSLNATLNSVEPMSKPKENLICNVIQEVEQNVKHDDDICKNISKMYRCTLCDYSTINKKDYNKHKMTLKHKKNEKGVNLHLDKFELNNLSNHNCVCGKKYKTQSGLWKHSQKCPKNPRMCKETSNTDIKTLTSIVVDVLKSNNELQKQNQELQFQLMEYYKNNPQTNNTL